MNKQLPLRIVGDIGSRGALAKIEKGRKIMQERKREWTQTDGLPVHISLRDWQVSMLLTLTQIEIPLPPENQYHSVFACPVSKD